MIYKVKIKDVQPTNFHIDEISQKKCFLGISLSNPFFHGKHLDRILKWIDENFPECKIVLADYLHRYNEYTFKGKNTEQAEQESKKMGEEIESRIRSSIQSMHSTKFTISNWLYFTDTTDFSETIKELQQYYSSNEEFSRCIQSSAQEFVDKQLSRGYHMFVTREEAICKSKDYFLEEMAVFSMLIASGYTVQVYPGTQLKVLKELANKKFEGLKTNLNNGIYIDLTVKKIR